MARSRDKSYRSQDLMLCEQFGANLLREAIKQLTPRQRDGLRLHFLRQEAEEGCPVAQRRLVDLERQIRRGDEIDARARTLQQQHSELTWGHARCMAEAALSRGDDNRE